MIQAQVINDDCRNYLESGFCPEFDLIFADPFFNIGLKYNGFNDNMTPIEYKAFTVEWMRLAFAKVKPGGVLVMHGSVEVGLDFLKAMDRLNIMDCFERKLIWAFNFGQNQYNNFVNTHCEIYVLRKPGAERKFNFEAVKIPSKRKLMGDKRIETAEHGGYIAPGSVWGVQADVDQVVTEPIVGQQRWGRVQGNNRERWNHCPTQLPENYYRRLIAGYTYPQDIGYDMFGGTGGFATVAKFLQRHSVTTEVDEHSCSEIEKRIEKGPIIT